MTKLSSSDRAALIQLAAQLPNHSDERRAILASLKEGARLSPNYTRETLMVPIKVELDYPVQVDIDPDGRISTWTAPELKDIEQYLCSGKGMLFGVSSLTQQDLTKIRQRSR